MQTTYPRPIVYLLLIVICSFMQAAAATAETRYVNDVLVITLREHPRDSADSIGTLKTGEPMEVLETQGSFIKVRTDDKKTGWVLRQYTSPETPKATVIKDLQGQIKKLKMQTAQSTDSAFSLKEQFSKLQEEYEAEKNRYQEELAGATAEINRLTEELAELQEIHRDLVDKSQRSVEIFAERDQLAQELQGTVKALEGERQKLAELKSNSRIYWFLAGAGVLLLGWLIGKFSYKRDRRKITL